MAKVHVVREMFSLDGIDYPRGIEITDPAVIEKVRKSHSNHLIPHHHDALAGDPAQSGQIDPPAPEVVTLQDGKADVALGTAGQQFKDRAPR